MIRSPAGPVLWLYAAWPWLASATPDAARAAESGVRWVGTWAASPQLADAVQSAPVAGFADTTLRQVVHVSIGGKRLRVRFSNAFGTRPLTLVAVRIARATGDGAIDPGSDRAVTFHGRESVSVPPGAPIVSDAVDFDLAALSDLAVSVYLKGAPEDVTVHPGSRTTSYLQAGNAVSAAGLPQARRVDHWYFLNGIDVEAAPPAAAVVVLGDSITDGRGSTTNKNNRWPDELARRLQANPATAHVAVVNAGIGGNRLLRDGLGPSALARLDRDVLAQPGAAWLIVLEGINDIGTRAAARGRGEPWASPDEMIAAYQQIVRRAQARGFRVYGGTIMPFEGAQYFTPDGEADRQAVNRWIRTGGGFDAVIDFDAAVRDREKPGHLSAAVDGGDHLHPGVDGHRLLAAAVDLVLFEETARRSGERPALDAADRAAGGVAGGVDLPLRP